MDFGKKSISDYGMKLLMMARDGDKLAENDLIEHIRNEFMGRRVGRYLNRNRQVDNDDIKQEFLIGVAMGIKDAKMDVGDPIEYIIHRGIYNVRGYMRKHIVQNTLQICNECGSRSRMNRIDNHYVCKKCGCTNVETFEVCDHDEIALQNMPEDSFEDELISRIMIENFKSTLNPGTNIYSLFVLLESGIDRDNPMVKNYIKAIADEWGSCSNENVVQNLNKLKIRMQKWIDENY